MATNNKNHVVNKEMAELILHVTGRDYAEWLDEQHQEVITKNRNVIRQVRQATVASNVSNNLKPEGSDN